MVRSLVACFVACSLVGCAVPVVSSEEGAAPADPQLADRPSPVEPLSRATCGGTKIANVASARTVHDLVFADDKLAWIGDSGVHVLDLFSHVVTLRNDPARHLASFRTDLVWSTSAVAMNARTTAYVRRSEGKSSRLVAMPRGSGATRELANGALVDAVALDANNAWFGEQSTDDSGTRTAFRRLSLINDGVFAYDALPGVAKKIVVSDAGAVALLEGENAVLAALSHDSHTPRVILQDEIRDFAVALDEVYATVGTTIMHADAAGTVRVIHRSSCEVGAIAASKTAIYFTAWNDEGGAIYKL